MSKLSKQKRAKLSPSMQIILFDVHKDLSQWLPSGEVKELLSRLRIENSFHIATFIFYGNIPLEKARLLSKVIERRASQILTRGVRVRFAKNKYYSLGIGLPFEGSKAKYTTSSTLAILPAVISSNLATPPKLGERILLLILSKDERVNIPGDLAEEYAEIAEKHGERFANIWYWKQVTASAWPLIWKALRWAIWAYVGAWMRRMN
jgi:hypothetical protein